MSGRVQVLLLAECGECDESHQYAGQLITSIDFDTSASLPPKWAWLRRGMEETLCCESCTKKLDDSDDNWHVLDDEREATIS